MKIFKIRTAIISIAFVLVFGLITQSPIIAGPIAPGTSGFLAAELAPPEPGGDGPGEISAQSAVVIELVTGRILYAKDAQQKVYPASTTKIMTALLALEEGNLDYRVTISEKASGVEGSSIYLEAGEKIKLEDLVYGLMLRSGNDAAMAISELLADSPEEFAKKMNERAKQIGAINTNFVNSNGLYDDNHYTTAYDMALMAREAMKNEEFKKIVGSKSWVADRGEGKYNTFYNKNKVIFDYEGGTGIKIGYTKASGRTLVASSERDGMELICVVMNAHNWFDDSYKLMDYGYENFKMVKIASAQRTLKTVLVYGGDKDYVFIGPREDILCPVPKDDSGEIAIAYNVENTVDAPVKRWEEAGKLDIFIDEEYIGAQPLYYMEDIDIILTETTLN